MNSAHTSSKPLHSYELEVINKIIIGKTSMGVVTSEDRVLHQHASSDNNSLFEVAQCPRYSAAVPTPGNWLEVSGLCAHHYMV